MTANPFNRKNLLAGALFALAISASAQVKSTHTDQKYANTTVVYKDTAASDHEVLNMLGDEYGLSDVVRVTVAPPKPAPAPAIDKNRGEDVWLSNPRKPEVKNLTASSSGNITPANQLQTTADKPVAPVATPVNAAPKATLPAAPKQVEMPAVAPAPPVMPEAANAPDYNAENAAPAILKTKSAAGYHAVKSAKASHKSHNGYGKVKKYKRTKRHFACPTF